MFFGTAQNKLPRRDGLTLYGVIANGVKQSYFSHPAKFRLLYHIKYSALTLLFVTFCNIGNSTELDSIFSVLDYSIKHKAYFEENKEKQIENLKSIYTEAIPAIQKYKLNNSLYNEYQKFKTDSAIQYAKKNIEIAENIGDTALYIQAVLKLANSYSLSGMYHEAESILTGIDKSTLDKKLLAEYYEAYREFFDHYSANRNRSDYSEIESYRDSLLSVSDASDVNHKINSAQQDIYKGNLSVAENSLLKLLPDVDNDSPDYAMVTYLLGNIYKIRGENELQKKYYALSAITDVKNSIKDNASIRLLALILYEEGDIDRAYRYTQSAIEDAVFCNVHFRTIQMSEFYTIINTAYIQKEATRKAQLQLYLALISILSLFLIVAVIYVYKQMKKLSRIKEELHNTNLKLIELNNNISTANNELKEKNIQLYESNHIKEEYIAHFFDLCSAYINKLENYRKTLNKKAKENKLDELFQILRSTTFVENELEELYSNFDHIFINLYPTFVEEFNALLIPEEQTTVKKDELLNTELRIFALIRLGITDSVKIAAFLRYSLSTIYNYRTKARNKAAVSRDEFEKMVMQIGYSTDN